MTPSRAMVLLDGPAGPVETAVAGAAAGSTGAAAASAAAVVAGAGGGTMSGEPDGSGAAEKVRPAVERSPEDGPDAGPASDVGDADCAEDGGVRSPRRSPSPDPPPSLDTGSLTMVRAPARAYPRPKVAVSWAVCSVTVICA